jgi:hypothetical protein
MGIMSIRKRLKLLGMFHPLQRVDKKTGEDVGQIDPKTFKLKQVSVFKQIIVDNNKYGK